MAEVDRLQRATRNGAGTGGGHPATREDDGRLVKFVARLTPPSGRETMSRPRIDWMWIMRHHDRLPGNRTAVTAPPPPEIPSNSLIDKYSTAQDDRHARAVLALSIRGVARYLWHRLSPRSFAGRRNGPGSPAPGPRPPVLSLCLKCALQCTACAHPAQRPGRVLLAWILRGPVAPGPRGRSYRDLLFTASTQATLHDSGTS